MSTTINVSRRSFLAVGGGLALGFVLPKSLLGQQRDGSMPEGNIMFGPTPTGPNAYIKIGTDDSVTLFMSKSEMGQGPTTACSQMIAEELECDWAKVRMEFAPVNPALYGYQSTVGSMAVRTAWDPMRQVGAAAREMLIQAAAGRWNVSPSQCRAENGFVINTVTGARINYGAVAEEASKLPVPKTVKLKQPKDYKIIGKPVKRLDTRDKVLGRAKYGIDVVVPGMVYASVEHCPVFSGKVASFDATAAKAVPGVKDVLQIPSGVAVIANSTWAAMQGRRALKVTWDEGPDAKVSSATIRQLFVEKTAKPGRVARKEGNVEAALAKAPKTVKAIYDVPFLAHAAMEPMNATIHAQGDKAEAWLSTQSPMSARLLIAEVLRIPDERVTIHRTHVGGGFGRRGEEQGNHVSEAAEIAKRLGVPVKVTWSREDDIHHDYYRPSAYAEFTGALDGAGWPSAVQAKVACPSMGHLREDGVDIVGTGGLSDMPYAFRDLLVSYHQADTHVPVRYWRAPGPSQNVFFTESFFDEMCAAGGKDPVEARRRLLAKEPRLLNVLNIAAEKAGYGRPLPAGHFHGVALASNTSYNAQVAEISIANGRIKVHRVVCAFDGGEVINPSILTQQISGGIIFGLSAALKHSITLDKGRVVESNFSNYDPIRMDEIPVIDVHIVESHEAPTGAGESTNPPILAAVANAAFKATGKRIRHVPIKPADLA